MEDMFFDVCVQVTILSSFVEEGYAQECVRIVDMLLTESAFYGWTQNISKEEVDHVASVFIQAYGEDVVPDIKLKLPAVMSKLLVKIDQLGIENEIAKKELQHQMCQETYNTLHSTFTIMLDAQKEEIDRLKWKELSNMYKHKSLRVNQSIESQGSGETTPCNQGEHPGHFQPLLFESSHDTIRQSHRHKDGDQDDARDLGLGQKVRKGPHQDHHNGTKQKSKLDLFFDSVP